MNLSEFSIRRPVTVWMILIAMIIFGLISIPKMAVDLYPELNVPVAVVVTSVDGGTPAEVEKLVTKPIEEALGSVEGVDQISSNSVEGASQVIVQFKWGKDLDQATLDMRDKVDQVRGMLPDSAKAPLILKLDPNSQPIIIVALNGDKDLTELKGYADDVIKPRLERVGGVASLSVTGGRDRVVDVQLDPAKLQTYGITLDQVRMALSATNLSGASGSVRQGDSKLNIRVQGEFAQIADFGLTPIPVAGGSILLKDIATIEDTYKQMTQKGYFNGEPTLGLMVTKASGGNTVSIAKDVIEEIENLKANLPSGMNLTVVMDNSKYISDSIFTVAEHALLGGGFAVLILYLFLNSVRSTLVVSIVLPISVIATFSLMYFTGQTINLISLSGLLLGLGSLVDFAVVILENIFRQRQQGKSMLQAAKEGSKQVGNAVMASALAQIVVFLPIIFVEGLAAELFGPLALTVIFSHIAALVVSIMLVPMLSSRMLKKIPDEHVYRSGTYRGINIAVWFNIGFEKLVDIYSKLLRWSLSHRKSVLSLTIAMFIGAGALVPMVGMEFIPKMDQGMLTITAKLPPGTLIDETEKVSKQIEKVVMDVPEFDMLFSSVGGGASGPIGGAASSNKLEMYMFLVDLAQRERSSEEVVNELRGNLSSIAGVEIVVKEMSGMDTGAPIQVSLRGDDLAVLEDISQIIAGEIREVQGAVNVETSLDAKQQEFQVRVDPQLASLYGLNTSQILGVVRTAFDGQKATTYRTGEDEIDVRIKLPAEYTEDIGYLERLRITTPGGANIPLTSVATLIKEDVPQTIKRANQTKEVQISGDIFGRDLGSIMRDVQAKIDQIQLPEGYFVQVGGQSEDMAESFTSLGLAMLLSIVLVYMVMAAQFESLLSPFIIMFSIPPTFIGVVAGLLIMDTPLSVMALIGYILLIGIVVNNAIVLIDFVDQLRGEGVERNEAILKAGPIRLRPILMTTLSTILAILPLAFGGGSGNEGQAPMAIVVAFGLSFSTVITLILIPVVYTLFDDMKQKLKNRKTKKTSPEPSVQA
ncbi:efflux RND transporter permease subunit [Ammoniphilus sp. CFH 90114]|uniref:efflux RND transporter permease subunit n=1 Tax=Ammoniphilus sp. CFH 90114 TaxID=2493665 RepID=UPI00100F2450|nr:efflux RND transporter permease subunit [Ammoniphilus sp. CFH 90114]RXT13708.1 efflux RND transporter permease subunit [Ammoniphilus sp. CFH 90114]